MIVTEHVASFSMKAITRSSCIYLVLVSVGFRFTQTQFDSVAFSRETSLNNWRITTTIHRTARLGYYRKKMCAYFQVLKFSKLKLLINTMQSGVQISLLCLYTDCPAPVHRRDWQQAFRWVHFKIYTLPQTVFLKIQKYTFFVMKLHKKWFLLMIVCVKVCVTGANIHK